MKLFLETEGVILVASSDIGQLAWCYPSGAIYTTAFLNCLKNELMYSKNADWSLILKGATKVVKRHQTPYYVQEVRE